MEPEKSETNTTTPRLANRRILWVEDDQFLSSLVGTKLAHEGCTYFHAKDGKEALQMAEHDMPDIMLLDLLLPGISGFDILKSMHENPKLTSIPVIVISNLGQKEDIEKAKMLGAAAYLIKAEHDLDDIINEIVKMLNEKKPLS